MIRADGLFRGGLEPVDHRLVIDKRRHSFFPGHLSVASHGLGAAFYDAVDGVLHGLAAFRIQASKGTGHFYEIGDHVVGLSAVDAADGHNARIYGVILPGDHGLKLGQNIAADGDGIDAVFRMSAVAAFAGDLDGEGVAGCVGRSFFQSDGAGVEFRRNVKADEYVRF